MQKAAVGFYWTLPVPWAGFTALPGDVEAAAKASRTIRYQREAVRRYAHEYHWEMVDEVVFLELQPDRGSAHVAGALRKAEAARRTHAAHLLYVDFAAAHGWRGHDPLREALGTLEVEPIPVPADPLPVDGEMFAPPPPISPHGVNGSRNGRRRSPPGRRLLSPKEKRCARRASLTPRSPAR